MTAAPVDWEHHRDPIDMIAELVDRHTHREHYAIDVVSGPSGYRLGQSHRVDVPSLLDQLRDATPTSTGDTDGGSAMGSGFRSQPAAHLESLDALIRIDLEAAAWIRDVGEDDDGDTAACVRRVGALMASMDRCHRYRPHRRSDGTIGCCQWHAAEADVRRWWVQARIITGWDSPAWRPDATCPMCDERGSLRVRLAARAAMCVACSDTWDPSTIGHLADHIRAETFEVRDLRRPPACGRVPGWEPEDLRVLCPSCGSSRCQRALTLRMDELT
ncbi:DUF7341 domain-containing protein [Nocardioides zeae]